MLSHVSSRAGASPTGSPASSRLLPALALVAATGLVALSAPAHARDGLPHPGFYVGIYGGYNVVLGDWDLNESGIDGLPEGSLMAGLRLGLQVTHWLGIEAGVAFLPFSADATEDLSGTALSWRLDGLFSPFKGDWSPHLLVGTGVYQLAGGDLGSDADWDLHWGLGLRGMLTDFMNLRVEARHVLSDGSPSGLSSNLEFHLGLDFWVWNGSKATPPKDTDADGIPDKTDACPLDKGDATASGCPDRDKDGIADAADGCPDKPGPASMRGCPDSDGDGVPDDVDQCVDVPGVADHNGCPPPPPDADSDGTPDAQDQCPNDPGPVHARGCPDQDGDGVIDADDKCPTQPGVAEEKGCLPKIIMRKFSGSVRGINFETGSAQIKKTSNALLNEAVKVFTQYPFLRIEITGHTDDQGPDDFNMKLSQDRAEAVRAYLIENGIDAGRLTAEGFGETRPVGNNKTAGGRAQNRRIEFKILGAN